MVPAATRGLTPSRWELRDTIIVSQRYPPKLAPLIYNLVFWVWLPQISAV